MKLTVVKIMDLSTHDGWHPMDLVKKSTGVMCIVSGVLIEETLDTLKLSGFCEEDMSCCATWVDLPKGAIIDRREYEINFGETKSPYNLSETVGVASPVGNDNLGSLK